MIAVRFVVAVATIAGLLGALALGLRALRNRAGAPGGRRLRVVETIALSGGAALHVVEAGPQTLIVGSAPGGVTLLNAQAAGTGAG